MGGVYAPMEGAMTLSRYLTVTAAIAALTSCGGTQTRNTVYNIGLPSHIGAAAATGNVPVVIHSEPYPNDESGAAVVAAMKGLPAYNPVTFTPATASGAGYHVVLAFGEAPVGSSNYCRDPGLTPRQSSSPTAIYSAFCFNQTLLSEAQVTAEAVSGPTDPKFREVMSALVPALMPMNDALWNNQHMDTPCNDLGRC
jgi:hypothetical protein